MLVGFLVGLLVTLHTVAQNTDSYAVAERFVWTDARIVHEVGQVEGVKFKFWNGFDFASTSDLGGANFTFDVAGANCSVMVQVYLHKKSGVWQVVLANARQKDGAAFDIKPNG